MLICTHLIYVTKSVVYQCTNLARFFCLFQYSTWHLYFWFAMYLIYFGLFLKKAQKRAATIYLQCIMSLVYLYFLPAYLNWLNLPYRCCNMWSPIPCDSWLIEQVHTDTYRPYVANGLTNPSVLPIFVHFGPFDHCCPLLLLFLVFVCFPFSAPLFHPVCVFYFLIQNMVVFLSSI